MKWRAHCLAHRAMACVLAGGRGSRLMELTERQAKPAVFFGGTSRIIDFALSNALNSGIRHISVAIQYEAHSLIRHLRHGWNFFHPERNESFDVLPAGQRLSESRWYAGTADAVYQNMDLIASYAPDYVVILAGDHVYKMDYEVMLRQHVETGADVTVGCLEVPRRQASSFGVMAIDVRDRIIAFQEKPRSPTGMPDKPDQALVSMGIYAFSTAFLFDQLRRDAADAGSTHDFGTDLIPHIARRGAAVAHRFAHSCVRSDGGSEAYWRDVGTVDAYWEANIDLTAAAPALDLYDADWPILTHAEVTPPAKFVDDAEDGHGIIVNCSVAEGCVVAGASLRRSILFRGVRVASRARLERAVILPDVHVGRRARLANVVVDRGVRVPDGLVVGEDAQRFRRTENGVCLITQAMIDRLADVA